MDRDYLTPILIMYKYFFFVCVKYWCETTDKIWLKWFTQSHTACVHQKSFLARCSSKEQPRVGWDQTGVGMRMARRLERRKVTKHTFSLSPARHTHTHLCTHKHRPTLQSCVCQMRVWCMIPVTASLTTCLWRLCTALCSAQRSPLSYWRYSETLPEAQSDAICTALEGNECLIKYWQRLKGTFAWTVLWLC